MPDPFEPVTRHVQIQLAATADELAGAAARYTRYKDEYGAAIFRQEPEPAIREREAAMLVALQQLCDDAERLVKAHSCAVVLQHLQTTKQRAISLLNIANPPATE